MRTSFQTINLIGNILIWAKEWKLWLWKEKD